MRIVRMTEEELDNVRFDEHVDWAKVASLTEDDIERMAAEDDFVIDESKPVRIYTPPGYVRAVRRRTGLTQAEFAVRFAVDVELLASWESGTVEPDSAGTTLLSVIDADPEAVARAVRVRLSKWE